MKRPIKCFHKNLLFIVWYLLFPWTVQYTTSYSSDGNHIKTKQIKMKGLLYFQELSNEIDKNLVGLLNDREAAGWSLVKLLREFALPFRLTSR